MPTHRQIVPLAPRWLWFGMTIVSSLVICFFLFQLNRYPLTLPLGYAGDAFFSDMVIKNTITRGFSFHQPLLGYPFGLELYDFPSTDTSYVAIVKLLSLFSTNVFVVANSFLIISFVACSLTGFVAFRLLKIRAPWAVIGGLLFGFLPFHLIRGPYHLFLGGYWVVPWIGLTCLWLLTNGHTGWLAWAHQRQRQWWGMAILGILVSTNGLYYSIFSLFLIIVSGIIAWLRQPQRSTIIMVATFLITTLIGLGVQLWPSMQYSRLMGKNQVAGIRHGFEADNNSLQLLRLLMPLQSFGLNQLRPYAFQPQQPLVDVEARQFLGWAAIVGLGIILVRALIIPSQNRVTSKRWWALFILILAIFILAMPSGVGTIVAYTISAQMRAYGRIQQFLAFFALSGLLLALEEATKSHRQPAVAIGISGILLIALLGQISWYQPPSATIQSRFFSDQHFFNQLEALKPTAVYQLPYKAFPETPPIYGVDDYDLLIGYLHTQQPIAWSYATMKGREGDLYFQVLAQFPLAVQIETARELGFSGLYIDRAGFADQAQTLEASASALLSQPAVTSQDRRLVYYQL